MPRSCSVCSHGETAAISKELLAGGSIRPIASRYGLTHAAVGRHLRGCLRTKRRAEESRLDSAPISRPDSSRFDSLDPSTLVSATARLVDEALDLLERAKRKDDRRTALVALREARDGLALLMKTAGMLQPDGAVTVNIDQRKLAFENLARLPEAFVRRMSAGDQEALDAVLEAGKNRDAITGPETLDGAALAESS